MNSSPICCPHCQGFVKYDAALAGRPLGCPHCQNLFTMPMLAGPPPPLPPPPMFPTPESDPYRAFAELTSGPLTDTPDSWNASLREQNDRLVENARNDYARQLRNARNPRSLIWTIRIIAAVIGLVVLAVAFPTYFQQTREELPLAKRAVGAFFFSFAWGFGIGVTALIVIGVAYSGLIRDLEFNYSQKKLAEAVNRGNLLRDQEASDCPHCRAYQAGRLLSRLRVLTDQTDEMPGLEKQTVTDAVGRIVGYIDVHVKVPYRIAVLRRTYQCSKCGGTWHDDERMLPGL